MTLSRHSKYMLLSWLVIAAVLLIPSIVAAQDINALKIGLVIRGTDNFGGIVIRLVDLVLKIAGIIAFLYVIYGGFMYLTSAGDPSGADKGRKTIFNALIGIIIISISYALVAFVAKETQDLNKEPRKRTEAPADRR